MKLKCKHQLGTLATTITSESALGVPCSQMNPLHLGLCPQTPSVCSRTSSPWSGPTVAAWRDPPGAHLWRGKTLEPPRETMTGRLPWERVRGRGQSSQEQGHTAEACSSFVAALVPGCTKAAEGRGLGSGQQKGTRPGEDPGCSACRDPALAAEDHRSGWDPDLLVFRSEAARRIPAEAGARRSGGEGCTGSRVHHCTVRGGRGPGSWRWSAAGCKGSTGRNEAHCSRRAG